MDEHIGDFCLVCVAFADNLDFSEDQNKHLENCRFCLDRWRQVVREFSGREEIAVES